MVTQLSLALQKPSQHRWEPGRSRALCRSSPEEDGTPIWDDAASGGDRARTRILYRAARPQIHHFSHHRPPPDPFNKGLLEDHHSLPKTHELYISDTNAVLGRVCPSDEGKRQELKPC